MNMPEVLCRKERREFKLFCPERMDVAERAVLDLVEALRILGIRGWTLPNIRERFVASKDVKLELGRIGSVTELDAEIVFDERFRKKELQELYERELRSQGLLYPGMEQAFKHELAHLVMWSVTGLRHQPAVRLVDEGWARLIELLGSSDAQTVMETTKSIKLKVASSKNENLEAYQRCLDLEYPISNLVKENLSSVEHEVGAALLLWILEIKGLEAMVDLMRKAPSTSRRTSTAQIKIPADLHSELHAGYNTYQRGIVEPLRSGSLSLEEMRAISNFARKWEAVQFRFALTEVTGFGSIARVREEFEEWLMG